MMKKLLAFSLLLFLLLLSSALCEEARDITSLAKIRISSGHRANMLDGNYRTRWEHMEKGAFARFTLPDDVPCAGVYLSFSKNTWKDYSVQVMRDGKWETVFKPSFEVANQFVPLSGATDFRVVGGKKGLAISRVILFSDGELPSYVNLFEPPCDTCDLLQVVAHPDDEVIWFGGLLPTYAAQGKKIQVVFMTCGQSHRRNELLDSLWTCGVRNAPIVFSLEDTNVDRSIAEALDRWGGRNYVVSLLVDTIRRFSPKVIVTQDISGEYGHLQHRATVSVVRQAFRIANDPAYTKSPYPPSAVQKVYLHLYRENRITLDWNIPLDAFHGETSLEVAARAFLCHISQQRTGYHIENHGQYDNAVFGLYFSAVGPDVLGNDLFEHVE